MNPKVGEILLIRDGEKGELKDGVWLCTERGELRLISPIGEELRASTVLHFPSNGDVLESCPEDTLKKMTGRDFADVVAMYAGWIIEGNLLR